MSKMRLLHLTILLLYISTIRVEAALIVYHRLKPNTDYIEPKDEAENPGWIEVGDNDHIKPDYSFMQSPSFKKLKLHNDAEEAMFLIKSKIDQTQSTNFRFHFVDMTPKHQKIPI